MENRQVAILAASLTLIAIAIFGYKILYLHFPLLPHTEVEVWDVEVRASFQAEGGPVKVSMYLPRPGGEYDIVDERFISHRYNLKIQPFVNDNRKVIWTIDRASGRQYLYYRATVRPSTGRHVTQSGTPPDIDHSFKAAELLAVRNILEQLPSSSGNAMNMTRELIHYINTAKNDANLQLLLGRIPSAEHKLEIITGILAVAKIPARIVNGFELSSIVRDAPRLYWLEVYLNRKWQAFNAITGERLSEEKHLAWWRGTRPLVTLEGGSVLTSQVSIALNRQSALQQAMTTDRTLPLLGIKYSLLSLPLDTQALYHILLVVPVGVFLLVILRNVIGIKTFGTFMPVLIALAFRETQLLWGIGLFTIIVALGLIIRFYLDRLKLLLVPRLSVVLIIVILLMAMMSILSYQLDLPRGLSVALFPIVIITMTIERMSIVWEERGAKEALEQGVGSLVAATAAYAIMNITLLQHFVFLFPELILILLAITLLLGRYSGYRLTELNRFRALTRGQK